MGSTEKKPLDLIAHIPTSRKQLPEMKSNDANPRKLSLTVSGFFFVAETYPRVSGTNEVSGDSYEQQAVFW